MSGGPAVVVAIQGVRMPAVRFVRSLSASRPVGMAWLVEGMVSGAYDRAGGVRKAVRSWCPLWTPDRTARTADGGQACGGSGIEHGVQVVMTGGSWRWSRLGLAEGEHVHCGSVRSGPGRVGRVVGRSRLIRGRVGRWARWRCPPLGRRRPDRVQTHRLGGHHELGCPADRTVERSAMFRRPASRCRVSGGTDRRRPCPGRCRAAASWRKRAPSRTVGMSGRGWRGPRGAHRAVGTLLGGG